jgi:SAM-dependent methyltransferase
MEDKQFYLCPPPFSNRYANAVWSARNAKYSFTYRFEAPLTKLAVHFPSSLPYDGQPTPTSNAENWDRLAAADAMWTVLSYSSKFGGKWRAEEFFETGAMIVERINVLEASGFHIAKEVAIDFGCGLGRVSRWLAQCFSHVVGVDISPKMLELAKTYNAPIPSITFVLGNELDIPLATSSADFVFSVIVLQHIARHLQERYIREFARLVRPGGYVYFQLPSHPIYVREVNFRTIYSTPSGPAAIEINTFPRADVEALLESTNCEILGVFGDESCGPGIKSFFYLARKKG